MEKQITPLYQVSEISVSYHPVFKASERPVIDRSLLAFEILRQTWDHGKIQYIEQFKVILLNRRNAVLGIYEVSTGGIAGTEADPKVIFAAALKSGSSSVILAHNHPSCILTPSAEDLRLTKRLVAGGLLLDIPVRDHLIISPDTYFSFADEGLL